MMKNEDILEVVTKLNIELHELGFQDGEVEFSVSSNGWVVNVEILGNQVWSTEDDDRDWSEETDDYTETLEDHLRRKFNELIDRFTGIEL